EDVAGVGLHLAGDDAHEGGLARAVASEQADALAGVDLEVDLVQDRRSAEAEVHVEQAEKRHKRSNVGLTTAACNSATQRDRDLQLPFSIQSLVQLIFHLRKTSVTSWSDYCNALSSAVLLAIS